jgi:putative oxidoreductase
VSRPAAGWTTDLGLLLLRVGAAALLIYGHGWPKLSHFAERAASFSDPLHVGSPISLGLVVLAEVLCAGLVLVGLATRWAAAPLLFFFAVAVFLQHAHDPWAKKELALIFATPFLALLLTGPGRFSLDAVLGGGRARRRSPSS